jgi:phage baseplate assembly protein W
MPQIQTSGLAFPLQITTGKHTVVSGVDLIQASLKTIISWPLFTRYYEDKFGSRLYELLEEPNDDILVNLIRRFVIDAIGTWEQRIELKNLL